MKSIELTILKQRVENLEYRLDQANRIISELLGALTCPSEELRMLVRDIAVEYMEVVHENEAKELLV